MGMFKSCLNCEHWIEGPPNNLQQVCGKYRMRPPTKIIICGCDEHTDNIKGNEIEDLKKAVLKR
jgi:hypothetical protein